MHRANPFIGYTLRELCPLMPSGEEYTLKIRSIPIPPLSKVRTVRHFWLTGLTHTTIFVKFRYHRKTKIIRLIEETMLSFTITTRKKDQIVDITETVENYLREEQRRSEEHTSELQ